MYCVIENIEKLFNSKDCIAMHAFQHNVLTIAYVSFFQIDESVVELQMFHLPNKKSAIAIISYLRQREKL